MKKEFGLLMLLLVLCVAVCGVDVAQQLHNGVTFSHLSQPRFISSENLLNEANLIGMYGIFSIGAGMVIITRGIDLTVGSMCALAGVLLSITLKDWQLSWPLAAIFVLAVPTVLGVGHGLLITKLRVQPFIVTL